MASFNSKALLCFHFVLLKSAIIANSSALHSSSFAPFPATLLFHIHIKQVDKSQTAGSSQDSEVRKLRMVMSLMVMLSNWLVRQERRGVATSRLCGHDRRCSSLSCWSSQKVQHAQSFSCWQEILINYNQLNLDISFQYMLLYAFSLFMFFPPLR